MNCAVTCTYTPPGLVVAMMPVRRYESCPVANRLGRAWRSPESDRCVVIVAAGRGQSPALYCPLRELQSTGRLDIQDAVGTQKFAGECSSSKATWYIKQMYWLAGTYYST